MSYTPMHHAEQQNKYYPLTTQDMTQPDRILQQNRLTLLGTPKPLETANRSFLMCT